MCLNANSNIPKIAEENIICYKIYIFRNGFVSPYLRSPIPKLKEKITTELQNDGSYLIEKGFHSFINLSDAEGDAKFFSRYYEIKAVISKCIIPKGSKYYKGKFGTIPSYCSESIIVDTIVSEHKYIRKYDEMSRSYLEV